RISLEKLRAPGGWAPLVLASRTYQEGEEHTAEEIFCLPDSCVVGQSCVVPTATILQPLFSSFHKRIIGAVFPSGASFVRIACRASRPFWASPASHEASTSLQARLRIDFAAGLSRVLSPASGRSELSGPRLATGNGSIIAARVRPSRGG